MTADATLRPLRWQDLASLARLEQELFPDDAWSEATWWQELAGRPRRHYVVAEGADGLVGYAGVDLGGDVADVMTMAVVPAAQGRGLGGRLVSELEARARAGGAAYLMLEVRADNAPAIALYERFGFERLSVRRAYYRSGPGQSPSVDGLVLRRRL